MIDDTDYSLEGKDLTKFRLKNTIVMFYYCW